MLHQFKISAAADGMLLGANAPILINNSKLLPTYFWPPWEQGTYYSADPASQQTAQPCTFQSGLPGGGVTAEELYPVDHRFCIAAGVILYSFCRLLPDAGSKYRDETGNDD